jgi:hypothetical protein
MVQGRFGNGIKRKEEVVSPFDRLQQILETMDVPEMRKGDVRWLMRNIQIRNSAHPEIDEAMKLLKKLNFVKPKQEALNES